MGLMLRINIPKRGQKVTNGDVVKAVFPNLEQDKERLRQKYGSQALYDTYEKWCELPYTAYRDCQTCENAKDGKCAGTEECHECMWDSQYKEAEQKTGKWIVHPKGVYAHLVCDKCLSNAPYDCRTNYCPYCGARMT